MSQLSDGDGETGEKPDWVEEMWQRWCVSVWVCGCVSVRLRFGEIEDYWWWLWNISAVNQINSHIIPPPRTQRRHQLWLEYSFIAVSSVFYHSTLTVSLQFHRSIITVFLLYHRSFITVFSLYHRSLSQYSYSSQLRHGMITVTLQYIHTVTASSQCHWSIIIEWSQYRVSILWVFLQYPHSKLTVASLNDQSVIAVLSQYLHGAIEW